MKKRALALILMLCLLVGMMAGMVTTASADGEAYVGFSTGDAYSVGQYAYDHHYTNSVEKLYVMEKSVFDSGVTPTQYNAEVAYCFNMENGWPKDYANYVNYTRHANVTNQDFVNVALKERTTVDLDKWVISVALNGYPLDYSGYGRAAGLSDDSFRYVTQKAIWYYSDSDSNKATDDTVLNMSATEKAVYAQLISNKLTDDVIAGLRAALDLFTTTDTYVAQFDGDNHTAYQNLLAINTASVKYLQVAKAVENGSASDTFTFNINVTPSTNNLVDCWVSDLTVGSLTKNKDGSFTAKLKNGQYGVIAVYADSFTYTVQEVNDTSYPSGYTYTAKIARQPEAAGTDDENAKRTISGSGSSAVTVVQFYNTGTAPATDPDPDPDPEYGYVEISKVVSGTTTTEKFDIEVNLTNNDGTVYTGEADKVEATKTSSTGTETTAPLTDVNGKVTFKLGANEKMKLKLLAGTKYSIDETNIPVDFVMTSTGLEGQITKDKTDSHTITNTYDVKDNELVIKKFVNGTATDPDTEFTFDLSIEGYNGDVYLTGTDMKAGTMTNGKGTIKLKDGQSVTLRVDAGKTFSIQETNVPSGYTHENIVGIMKPTTGATTIMTNTATDDMKFTGSFAAGTDDYVATITFTNKVIGETKTTDPPTTPTTEPATEPSTEPSTSPSPESTDPTPAPTTPATPAPSTPRNPGTTVTPSPAPEADDPEPEVTVTEEPTVTDEPQEDAEPTPTEDESEKLPQTGNNWWPVVIFGAAGTALVAIGLTQHKRKDRR
jgi:TQXA domain-containing protein